LAAFAQTLGYLLAWQVVLKLVEQASDELRPKYSEFIENKVASSYRFPDVHYLVREPLPPPFQNDFPLQKYDNNSPCHATILAFHLLFCIYFYINSVFPLPFLTHVYSLFSLPFLTPPPPQNGVG
jgi:hypothetical protein